MEEVTRNRLELEARTLCAIEAQNQDAYWERVGSAVEHELEDDLYTNVFVSFFEVNTKGRKTLLSYLENLSNKLIPLLYMVAVNMVQLITIYGVYNYVIGPEKQTREYLIATANDLIIGSGNTLPIGLSQSICGAYEQEEISAGEFSQLTDNSTGIPMTWGPGDLGAFYSIPQPTRTWSYQVESVDHPVLQDALYVMEGGTTLSPFTKTGYSALFIMMVSVWMFTIIVELRSIFHFTTLLFVLRKQDPEDPVPDLRYNESTGKFRIIHLSANPFMAGLSVAILRLTVAAFLIFVGTYLLFLTMSRFDLILNSIALLFVLELDNIIYSASISIVKQQFIDDIEPPIYQPLQVGNKSLMRLNRILLPVCTFMSVMSIAMVIRMVQVRFFYDVYLHAASVCLFAGPTNPATGGISPAVGMCESLLSATCFPAEPKGTTYGHCLVTDMRYGKTPGYAYPIGPSLWDDGDASLPWTKWGKSTHAELKHVWVDDAPQEKLRKVCATMYSPSGLPDSRVVDSDSRETMRGAPFYCNHDGITSVVLERGRTVTNFLEPDVVNAFRQCHKSTSKLIATSERVKTSNISSTAAQLIYEHTSEKRPVANRSQPLTHQTGSFSKAAASLRNRSIHKRMHSNMPSLGLFGDQVG